MLGAVAFVWGHERFTGQMHDPLDRDNIVRQMKREGYIDYFMMYLVHFVPGAMSCAFHWGLSCIPSGFGLIWTLLISMDQHIWLHMSCAGPRHSAHEWLWFLAKSVPEVWHKLFTLFDFCIFCYTWIWWTLGFDLMDLGLGVAYTRWITIVWNILDFQPPCVSLPLAVARWYILQVKCPKQRQQKEPQSDDERKIAALSAWFGFGCCPWISWQHSPVIGSVSCPSGLLVTIVWLILLWPWNSHHDWLWLGALTIKPTIPVIRLCLQTSPTGILRGGEMNIYIYI